MMIATFLIFVAIILDLIVLLQRVPDQYLFHISLLYWTELLIFVLLVAALFATAAKK